MMTKPKLVVRAGAIAALATVTSIVSTSCSILPDPAPAAVIYRLSVDGSTVEPRADAEVIRVDRPGAVSVFNTKRVLVTPDGRRMSAAAQAQWVESIPLMVQESLIDAMNRSETVIGVLPSSGARTDTRVFLTVKNFEAQFDRGETAAPLAVVRYTASLANASNRDLIDTFSVRKEVRADAARVSDIVSAIERANDAAMTDIVRWLEDTRGQQARI